ncbi:MAG: M20/M25/M40 family metallo-hydrolase [bacterium]
MTRPLRRRLVPAGFLALVLLLSGCGADRAVDSITADELRAHLEFIASDEMMGRDTPSPQLKLAARYLAVQAASCGFQPLMESGSYLQEIPLERIAVDPEGTRLAAGGRTWRHGPDFGGRFAEEGSVSGRLVLVGWGMEAPDQAWDDYDGLALEGRVAVILDAELPEDHTLMAPEYRMARYRRSYAAFEKGAEAVIEVIGPGLEERMSEEGMRFPVSARTIWPGSGDGPREGGSGPVIQVRWDTAAGLLGVPGSVIRSWFEDLARGERVEGRPVARTARLDIALARERDRTQNVVAWLEGSDPVLKQEYVILGSHYDHVGARGGEVYNGADDDGSGTVAMLEIAEAFSIRRPKRSVVMVWHTGEEKGLRGARHFVQNSPVPLEKVTAMLQMDMLSRNEPDSIYAIGSHFLSSELDALLRKSEAGLGVVSVSDRYNDPQMQGNYFRQSDHHAYHQAGIPTIFFFCGVHEDLHRPTDTVEKCDFDKMARVSRLVYALGRAVGDHPVLLALDRDPEVTERGLPR